MELAENIQVNPELVVVDTTFNTCNISIILVVI